MIQVLLLYLFILTEVFLIIIIFINNLWYLIIRFPFQTALIFLVSDLKNHRYQSYIILLIYYNLLIINIKH
jgi:hypothetical protein